MIDDEDRLPGSSADEPVTDEETVEPQTSPYAPDPLPAAPQAPAAVTPAPAEENPFAKYASEQPVAQNEENPFAKFNSDKDIQESSASGAFVRGAVKGVVPTVAALPAIGFGAEAGAELGAVAGPYGAIAGGFIGGLAGGAVGGVLGTGAQDFALSLMPDDLKKKMGLDDEQAILDEAKHPYASQIGGLTPFLVTARPWAAPGTAPMAATISKRVQSDLLQRGFSGAVMGGWEFGNEAYHGNVDWNKVAIATAFGTMFPHQNKYGTAVIETGQKGARYTLGQARDLGVFGPGHNEDTFQGDSEANQVAKEASHQYARDEEAEVQGPRLPGPEQVTDAARKMEPELFDEYDRLTAIKEEARAAIDEINNGSPKRVSELSKELVQAQRDYSEFVKGRNGYEGGREARVMRQNIRTIQNELSSLENRPMELAETEGADNDLTARHRQELIKADEALRDLAPKLTEAKRRAAIGLGRGDFVIEPKPAEATPGEAAQAPAQDFTADRKAIAAEATKRALEAGRPEEEAKAYGELTASRYISRASRFEGKLGTPLELYHAEGSQIRSWEPAKKVQPGQLPEAPAAEKPVEVTGEVSVAPQEVGSGNADLATEVGTGIAQKDAFPIPPAPEPAGPKAGDTITLNDTRYKIEAIDDNSVKLVAARKKDKALPLNLRRNVFDQMLGEHVAPTAKAEGEKITINGEALDPKLAEVVRSLMAKQEGASKEMVPGRLPDTPDMAAMREKMRQEAMSDEYPVAERPATAPDVTVEWQRFSANAQEAGQSPGFVKWDRLRSGSPNRARAKKDWTPGNIVDVGFVKDLLVVSKNEDGSFTLLGKPDSNGESQRYISEPHKGVSKEGKVDFLSATEALREPAPAAQPVEPTPIVQRVTTANGTAVDVKPMVVEAADLLTSSDAGYDKALQPRNRERAASQGQIRDIATRLDPNRLGSSSEADRGAPIVGPDNMVESGNGRVMAIREAYRQNGQAAQRYRDWIASQGIDVTKYKEPVLVRQRVTEMTPEQRKAFTVEANQSATLAMSASERAMADARMLSTETLDLVQNPDDLAAIKNRGFVQAFVRGLPQSEQGMMTTAEGGLSSEGLARVRNAVLAKAYGDASLMARIAEATSDEVKSISNALTSAAPKWAKLRSDVEAGLVRADMDLTPELMEAVKRTADLRSKGVKLDSFLAQQDAFDKLNPTVEAWMRMFYNATGRRAASAADIAERVNFYAQEARKVSAQEGLAFDLTPVRSEDVQALAAQKGKENGGSTDQANLFEPRSPSDGSRNEASGQEAGRQGTGEGRVGPGEAGAGQPESRRGNGEVFEQRRQQTNERLAGYNTKTREIWLGKKADPSSIIHESGHQYLEELTRDATHGEAPEQVKADLETVKDWVSWKRGQSEFTRKQHEKFAKGFERYIYDGVAPSKELASVFERFTNWLREVYQSIRGLKRNGIPELTPEIRSVFDRLLAAEPRRTVVAGEIKTGRSLGAVHEAEAVKMTHREAGAKADRADNERAQFVKELPAEVKNELAAAAERNGRSVRELGASDADGRGMAEDRSGQGARAGSGAGSQGGGAQRGGNGENAAEGFSASSGNDGNGYVPRERASFSSKEGKFVDKAGNIRLENITNEEDLRDAAREVAAQNDGFIGDRRGVVTDGQVHDLATAIGDEGAWRMVDKWAKGSAYNAEEIMAMRLLFQKQLAKVVELAKAAKAAGEGDWQAMRDYAVERDRLVNIQKTVSGATAEWGRAGRSFRDISGSKDYQTVNKLFQENTGRTLFQTRVELDLLSKLDDPEAAANFLRNSDRPGFHRYILEYWINNLISGPVTHATYMVGNDLLAMYRAIPETIARAAVSKAMQAAGRKTEAADMVHFGEVMAQVKGFGEGFAPALKAAAGSLKTGVTTLLPGETMRNLPGLMPGQQFAKPERMDPAYKMAQVMPDMFGAIRGMKDAVIAYGQMLDKGVDGAPLWSLYTSPLGVIPDIAYKGVPVVPIGSAIRVPGRFIQAIHAFHRVNFYAMELNAEAYRKASAEGLTGDAFAQRVAELKKNPDLEMIKRSADAATEGTMMGQGGEFTRNLAKLTNTKILGVPWLKFIDPFVHITGNVIEQSLGQRTPLALFSPDMRADLSGKNGTHAQDKAMGRIMLGTAVSAAVAGYVMEGSITGGGPKDREEKGNWERLGIQPYSVKIGDTWYSYHRLGALGLLIGVAADMYKVAEKASKEEMAEAGAALLEAFSHNILEESFMRGPSELFRAIENPKQYGASWARNFLSSFAPASVGMSQITRATDPYSRQARTIMDAFAAKYPWSAGDLTPRRDLWGEPIANKQLTMGTAIYQSPENRDLVNREMYRLNVRKSPVDKKIRNIELSPEQQDDYARIAGRLTKMQLDQVVNSPDYERMPDFQKMDVIEKVFDVTRKAARETMLQKYPQLIHDAITLKMNRYSDEGLERQ